MGTAYNGLPANVVAPSPIAISSSTNTSPIQVTFSTAHGCMSGDWVDISGHQVNTNANGVWNVAFVSSTELQLTGSTGNGVGGATGSMQPPAFTGNVSLNPANGDALSASTWIPGMSCLADRASWLALATGGTKIVSHQETQHQDDTLGSWLTISLPSFGSWVLDTATTFTFGINCAPLDVLQIEASYNVQINASSALATAYAGFWASCVVPGASDDFVRPVGAMATISQPGPSGSPAFANLSSRFYVQAPNPGGAIFLKLKAAAYAQNGTPTTMNFAGDYFIRVLQLRSTGAPQ